MTNVLIVYTTSTGNTQQMALAIAAGAQSVQGTTVNLKEAQEATKNDVRACDALIIGSPMRHRTADSRIKKFIEDVCEQLWLTDEMVGKVGGVFTVGGGYGDCGAGCELAQLGLLGAFAAGGMILVTLPKTTPGFQVAGMHWGPHGRSGGPEMEPIGITEEMKLAGWHHGANIARVTAELRGKNLLARGNVAPSKELLEQFANA
ncbi:hypothetical protein F7734_03870 [Scytonema sp. UIC 10036]|uniref:flavodoxin domain-containing protein n=1 Tax=Scytonema sp. UIC 10036 TaxID=2304196 RepID=UPI0012DACBE1|nr:flavodoxin domain-containing protein [Scytonema sp. UIC 10036]MUG91667.1 hypothetical protein [Scytonema sp. UIC 10036]